METSEYQRSLLECGENLRDEKKRRLVLLGHMYRMEKTDIRLHMEQEYNLLHMLRKSNTPVGQILNRDTCRSRIQGVQGFKIERTTKTGRTWTDEQGTNEEVLQKDEIPDKDEDMKL